MDVEFSVDVIPNKRPPAPRIETSTSIIAMGLGSLDDAFREATSNMAQWLADDYNLTSSEVASSWARPPTITLAKPQTAMQAWSSGSKRPACKL